MAEIRFRAKTIVMSLSSDIYSDRPKITSWFKVDRLQIILVAKKYISTCRNCVQFHNWFRLH